MKMLLTGAFGQVGSEIVKQFAMLQTSAEQSLDQLIALGHTEFDITQRDTVFQTIAHYQPTVVVNTAAYTAVDKAESHSEQAYAVNQHGATYLAQACAHYAIPLLHLSTDYVFDGKQNMPYQETDPAAPINVYGLSKWLGEQAIRAHCPRHLIIRTSWVFGITGSNFVKTIIRLAQARESLQIVADQWGCPTYASDIAKAVLQLAAQCTQPLHPPATDTFFYGTYHYAGIPAITWYGFAQAIIDQARLYTDLTVREIKAISTVDYPTAALRPLNSQLDCRKIAQWGVYPSPWSIGLQQMIKTHLTNQS